jgi:hypothetical protein
MEDGDQLRFFDDQGKLTAASNLADLQGFSVDLEPRPSGVAIIVDPPQERPASVEAEGRHTEIWHVTVRGKEDLHYVEGADVKQAQGRLVFTDLHGDLAGWFYLAGGATAWAQRCISYCRGSAWSAGWHSGMRWAQSWGVP